MPPSARTATPRGPAKAAPAATPWAKPAPAPRATTLTAPAGVTRTMRLPSATMASPLLAAATATGCVSAVVTVETLTPPRYDGAGGGGPSTNGVNAVGPTTPSP